MNPNEQIKENNGLILPHETEMDEFITQFSLNLRIFLMFAKVYTLITLVSLLFSKTSGYF